MFVSVTEMIDALDEFELSAKKLTENWDNFPSAGSNEYPFDVSFDEIVFQISNCVEVFKAELAKGE